MKTYTIERTNRAVPLDGTVADTAWGRADEFAIDEFNWYESGPRPVTTGRVLYDEDALYLRFTVEDPDITANVTTLNGPTYRDSSVEFFADPTPDADSKYFNFEPNCVGAFKLAWQEDGWEERGVGRDLVTPDLADEVTVVTSIPSVEVAAATDEQEWILAAELPFDVLSALTGVDCRPQRGTEWRGNFYRSGVQSPSQKATWNPMQTPEPDYHSPEYFGRLRFE